MCCIDWAVKSWSVKCFISHHRAKEILRVCACVSGFRSKQSKTFLNSLPAFPSHMQTFFLTYALIPIAQMIKHGAGNFKVMGLIHEMCLNL